MIMTFNHGVLVRSIPGTVLAHDTIKGNALFISFHFIKFGAANIVTNTVTVNDFLHGFPSYHVSHWQDGGSGLAYRKWTVIDAS